MEHRFSDLVDLPALRRMMDSQWKLSGISAAVEAEGGVLAAVGQESCPWIVTENEGICPLCDRDRFVAERLREQEGREPVEHRCPNGSALALPVFVEDRPLALLWGGRLPVDSPRRPGLRRGVSVVSKKKIRENLEVHRLFLRHLADMGLHRLRASGEAEGKFRRLFESSSDGIFLFAPDGRILEANRAAGEQVARDSSELLGRSIRDLFPLEDGMDLPERMKEVREKGSLVFETQQMGRDGVPYPVEVRIRPFDAPGEAAFVGISRDIGKCKRAEEAVRSNSERFRTIFESAAAGMAVISPDGRLKEVNPAFCRFLGYRPEELLGREVLELTHPLDREDGRALMEEARAGERRSVEQEKRYLRRDGRVVWGWVSAAWFYDETGAPVHSVAMVQDVTERRNAQEALRRREALERLLSGISRKFVELPPEDADLGIDFALRSLGEFAGIDRVFALQLSDDRSRAECSNRWRAENISHGDEAATELDAAEFPWSVGKILDRQSVYLPTLEELPPEARREREILESRKVKSLLLLPIFSGRRVSGALGFEAVSSEKFWEARDLELLGTVGEILGNAIDRRLAVRGREALLREMETRIRELQCLHELGRLTRKAESLETLFEEAVKLLPAGWQYPDIARARVVFDGREFLSEPFEEIGWMQAADLLVGGRKRGRVEIHYLEERPNLDEGPFLQEEWYLIDSIASTLGDAVDRREARLELERGLARLEEAQRIARLGLWDWDLRSDGLVCSDEVLCIFGLEPKAEPYRYGDLSVLVHPEDRAGVERPMEGALRGGGNYSSEYRIILPGGEVRHIQEQGKLTFDGTGKAVRIMGTILDISERKEAEAILKSALDESETARGEIRAILESVADGLVVTDLFGRIVLMNAKAEDLLGLDWRTLSLEPLWEAFSDPALGRRFADLRRQAESGPADELDLPAAGGDGFRKVQVKASPVWASSGASNGVIFTLRDVTLEKEFDRMKSEFISTAAHELRTPLTSVKGFSQLLLEHKDLDSGERDRYLSYIYDRAEALDRIICDMLDLSRVESGKLVDLQIADGDIGALVDEAVGQHQAEFVDREIRLSLPPNELPGLFDAQKIRQVMDNLLGNAMKFSARESTIHVDCRRIDGQARVAVRDEGIGMTEEEAARVFDKFYRADASSTAAEGLGLGMAIVKGIIEAHCGSIGLESRRGEGTEVAFMLPLQTRGP